MSNKSRDEIIKTSSTENGRNKKNVIQMWQIQFKILKTDYIANNY